MNNETMETIKKVNQEVEEYLEKKRSEKADEDNVLKEVKPDRRGKEVKE